MVHRDNFVRAYLKMDVTHFSELLLVPNIMNSVLSLFSLRQFWDIQISISLILFSTLMMHSSLAIGTLGLKAMSTANITQQYCVQHK